MVEAKRIAVAEDDQVMAEFVAQVATEAALGGWIGIMIANGPQIFLTRRQIRKLHISWLRIIAGTLLALAGFIYALNALKLIG